MNKQKKEYLKNLSDYCDLQIKLYKEDIPTKLLLDNTKFKITYNLALLMGLMNDDKVLDDLLTLGKRIIK